MQKNNSQQSESLQTDLLPPYSIVVVEDELFIRQNIVKKIRQITTQFRIIGEASDGESALKIIEKNPPDLVITDIRMPIMDGLELIKNLYFAFPNVKVIIISGFNDFEYAKKALQLGVKDFLLKPIVTEDFQQALQNILILLDRENKSLSDMVQENVKTMSQEEIAQYVEHFIRENYTTDLTVGDLATRLGFSPDYLSKVFKKQTGHTLIRYITRLRINEAKRLLVQNPELEVQKVGEMVGYPDPFYFSRVFKKQTDVYPSEFAQKGESQ